MSEDTGPLEKIMLKLNGDVGRSESSGEAIAKARKADPLVDIMLDVQELNALRQQLPESTGNTVRHSAFSIAGSLMKLGLIGGAVAEAAQYAQTQDPNSLYFAGGLAGAGMMWDNVYHGAKAVISNIQHKRLQRKIDTKEESLREKLTQYQPESRETPLLENLQDNPEVQAMLQDTMRYVETQQREQGEKVESLAVQVSEESRKQGAALDDLQSTLGHYVTDRSNLQGGIDANNSDILALRRELRSTQAALDGMSGIKSETGEKLRALEGITEDAKVSLTKTEKALLGARSESDKERYQEIVNLDARTAFKEYRWPHHDKPNWSGHKIIWHDDYGSVTGSIWKWIKDDYFGPGGSDLASALAIIGLFGGGLAGSIACSQIIEQPETGTYILSAIAGAISGVIGLCGIVPPVIGTAVGAISDTIGTPLVFLGNRIKQARNHKREIKHKERFGFEADLEYSNPFVKVVKLPNRKFKNKSAFRDHVYSIARALKSENLYATVVLDVRDSVIADNTDGKKGESYDFLGISEDPSTRHDIGIKYHSDAELEDFGFNKLEELANSGVMLVNTKNKHYNQINDAEFDANLMTAIRRGTEYMANQASTYLNFLGRKARAVKGEVLENAGARSNATTQLRTLGNSAARIGELMKNYSTP
jgi:hypothetical protein